MEVKIVKNGESGYPITTTTSVVDSSGRSVDLILKSIAINLTEYGSGYSICGTPTIAAIIIGSSSTNGEVVTVTLNGTDYSFTTVKGSGVGTSSPEIVTNLVSLLQDDTSVIVENHGGFIAIISKSVGPNALNVSVSSDTISTNIVTELGTESAAELVSVENRRTGASIVFLNEQNVAVTYKYRGADTSNWADESYWVNEYEDDIFNKLSATNGYYNTVVLNHALAEGDVKLKKGSYPMSPMVVVEDVTLDLNGSCLQSTENKFWGPLILMQGSKPVVRNGELCGNYDIADDEEGYSFFEKESLISIAVGGYDDALIEGVELHNCWGYSVSNYEYPWPIPSSYNKYYCRKGITTFNAVDTSSKGKSTNFNEFITDSISIESGYKYLCWYGGYGYNYIISDKEVEYKFYDSDGNQIGNVVKDVPRMIIPIPSGAVTVTVKQFRYENSSISAFIGYYNYTCNQVIVRNCCMHNNHSLGMVGFANGYTKVYNCTSYENGKPRSLACASTNSTTGFIDVEDYPSPYVIIENCTSRDELHFAMIGAYNINVSNCYGGVIIYRGWNASITNCIGIVKPYNTEVKTFINTSNCVISYPSSITIQSINWTGTNNVFIDCYPADFNKEKNFIIKKINAYTAQSHVVLKGVVVGKVYNPCSARDFGVTSINTYKGSDVTIEFNYKTDADDNWYGTSRDGVIGDCYGIKSTAPIFPNGHTIYESTFTPIHSFGLGNATNDSWTGKYVNCVFNLDSGSMFWCNEYSKLKLATAGSSLVFENCVINNSNNYLFKNNMGNLTDMNYTVKFINCTIADETKLFATEPTDFTYEIVNIDYNSEISSLKERLAALEENLT